MSVGSSACPIDATVMARRRSGIARREVGSVVFVIEGQHWGLEHQGLKYQRGAHRTGAVCGVRVEAVVMINFIFLYKFLVLSKFVKIRLIP